VFVSRVYPSTVPDPEFLSLAGYSFRVAFKKGHLVFQFIRKPVIV
jgi:hypothetical protein